MTRGLARAALAAALLAAFAAGCGRSARDQAGAARDSAAAPGPAGAYVNPADAPEPEPARPAGPPVGRHDALVNSMRPALAEWVAMWRAAIPGFEPDSLWKGESRAWKPAWDPVPAMSPGWASSYPFEDAPTAAVFTVTSPDSAYDLQINTYLVITDDAHGFSVSGEPDSRSALHDRRRARETVLEFSGTMGSQDWGRWLGPRRFVLAGTSDESPYGHWKSGWISVYSLEDSTVTSYTTRAVADTAFLRYHRAWEDWVHRRYLALKPRV